jgi:hypothetical protein
MAPLTRVTRRPFSQAVWLLVWHCVAGTALTMFPLTRVTRRPFSHWTVVLVTGVDVGVEPGGVVAVAVGVFVRVGVFAGVETTGVNVRVGVRVGGGQFSSFPTVLEASRVKLSDQTPWIFTVTDAVVNG